MTAVVFIGSPDFSVPILQRLADHYKVVGVVSQPDRRAGRGLELKHPPVQMLARYLGLPAIQPEKLRVPEAMEQLRRWSPDIIVVAAFGQILRADVLGLPPFGCINVHASLLPRWRGAAPVQAAILAGDAETGVTIMKMDEGVDTGGILARREISIEPEDTGVSLSAKLSYLGAELLIETLPRYLSGEVQPQPQDNHEATHAPMLKKEDGLLDLTQPAVQLQRRIRALNPWPGAQLRWNGQVLKVHRAHVQAARAAAGSRLVSQGRPAVGTSNGILILDEVQPAGKKPMDGTAFVAGARQWAGK
jgi:methionyl-tRNA formyltransferase